MEVINMDAYDQLIFDKLVLRAALNKRNDLIDRYGDDKYSKMLAKGKRKDSEDEEPAIIKKLKYYNTIQSLMEDWETAPWNDSNKIECSETSCSSESSGTENIDNRTTKVRFYDWERSPPLWECSAGKEGDKCKVSRRHSMNF